MNAIFSSIFSRPVIMVAASAIVIGLAQSSLAQNVVNPGFNDNTGWALANDAELAHPGGVAPWTWNTPVVAALVVEASETVLPTEGSGMGITYAGSDSFTQSVIFPSAGNYSFSIEANAVTGGTTATPGPLVDGLFSFFVDGVFSPGNSVPRGDGWKTYEWSTFVTAGAHDIGILNTLTASYVIAYDNFAIIPEPATAAILAIGLPFICVAKSLRRRRGVN